MTERLEILRSKQDEQMLYCTHTHAHTHTQTLHLNERCGNDFSQQLHASVFTCRLGIHNNVLSAASQKPQSIAKRVSLQICSIFHSSSQIHTVRTSFCEVARYRSLLRCRQTVIARRDLFCVSLCKIDKEPCSSASASSPRRNLNVQI